MRTILPPLSVTSKLIIVNIIAFIVSHIMGYESVITNFGIYHLGSDMFSPIQIITHMFLHGGVIHLLFNMITLLSFGIPIERHLGSKKFLLLYFIFGVFAAFFNMVFFMGGPVIGASGAIFGLFLMFALMYPDEKVYVFFIPIGIKVKYIASSIFLLEVIFGVFNQHDHIAHFAHVGGGIAGVGLFFLNKYIK